ncbi:MAG TPA: YcnI family protein [Burkholderiales bacterium]|nr:YcnI family protein [Burkholderiales bacterium]
MRTILLSSLLFVSASTQAHITLEQGHAQAGAYYKTVLGVPHGCEGSSTRALTVFLPEGFVGAKPMPKAGWTLDVKKEKLSKPYEAHGRLIDERVAVVSWSGGRLLDTEYDEFVIRLQLPAEPGVKRFRVLQQCEQGQIDWSEAPAEGKPAPRYPSPTLEVRPAEHGLHHH